MANILRSSFAYFYTHMILERVASIAADGTIRSTIFTLADWHILSLIEKRRSYISVLEIAAMQFQLHDDLALIYWLL